MTEEVKRILLSNKLKYNVNDTDLTMNLTTPEEKQFFKKINLPDDILMLENTAILKNYNRWPLIIDPNNQLAT